MQCFGGNLFLRRHRYAFEPCGKFKVELTQKIGEWQAEFLDVWNEGRKSKAYLSNGRCRWRHWVSHDINSDERFPHKR